MRDYSNHTICKNQCKCKSNISKSIANYVSNLNLRNPICNVISNSITNIGRKRKPSLLMKLAMGMLHAINKSNCQFCC